MTRQSVLSPGRLLTVGLTLIGLVASSSSSIAATADSPARSFIVFDATLYKNKPSFAGYTFRPIKIVYEARLFPKDHPPQAAPTEPTVRSIAKELGRSQEPVILDIERWPLKGDVQAVKASIGKFLAVLAWMKHEAPTLHIGAYGTVPLPDYWRAIRGQASKDYQVWQQDNDRLDELSAHVDAFYPSLYTFYPDRQGWVTYAIAQLTEAKRLAKGKPVYAFLWPQYHDSNASLRFQPVEPDYWELQLQTVHRYADGLVIWGGWGDRGPEPWNEGAPWWQVTKQFMKRISSAPPGPVTNLTVQ